MARKVGVRVIAVAATLLSGSPVFSQKGGPAGTGGTGSTGTGTTGTTGTGTTGTGSTTGVARPTSTNTTGNTQQNPTANIPQPVFVSGRVMIEDGTPPTEPVVLMTVCNGQNHSEGYTDSKGYFSLELGANRGVIQDASEYSNTPNSVPTGLAGTRGSGTGQGANSDHKYMGCDLQARLSGFRSQSVNISNRRPMDDPNVGTILLHRLGKEEGQTVSMVSLAAPKEAKKAYDKGMDFLKKKKFADAQDGFEKAVELYPGYAVAWYELGRLRVSQDQLDIARGSFEQAIKSDPKFVLPYMSLAILELEAKRWPQLVEVTEKITKLDPFDYPQAFFFNSVANFNMRNLEASEKSALEAERLDTRNEFPQLQHLLGMILADRKDWAGAEKRFKDYLRLAPTGTDAALVRTQLSQVEKIQQQVAGARQ